MTLPFIFACFAEIFLPCFACADAGADWWMDVLVVHLCLVHPDLWTDASGCMLNIFLGGWVSHLLF
jgi:hypothetical protein